MSLFVVMKTLPGASLNELPVTGSCFGSNQAKSAHALRRATKCAALTGAVNFSCL